MKRSLTFILVAGLFSVFAFQLSAQEDAANDTNRSFFDTAGGTVAATNIPTSIPLEERKPIEYNKPRADDIVWQKVVYRVIDLREKINFPLYFPIISGDGRQSLFTTIFRLYQEDKIRAYQYMIDNREVFTDNYLENFDVFYERNKDKIMLTVTTDSITGDTLSSVIEEVDIPNTSVLKYYLKEVWYFDKHNSVFTVRIMAICPKLFYENDETGKLEQFPLFWVPFDDLRPHLAQQEVLITDKNNGARETMDDLFIKRRFGSYIFKASSVKNRSILEYNTTQEQMRREQDRIQTEIYNVQQDLWEY